MILIVFMSSAVIKDIFNRKTKNSVPVYKILGKSELNFHLSSHTYRETDGVHFNINELDGKVISEANVYLRCVSICTNPG